MQAADGLCNICSGDRAAPLWRCYSDKGFLVCSSTQKCSCKLICAVLNQSLCSSKNNLNHHLICIKHIRVSLFSVCALISSAVIQPYADTDTPSDQQFGIKTESAQHATDSQPTIDYRLHCTVSTIFATIRVLSDLLNRETLLS